MYNLNLEMLAGSDNRKSVRYATLSAIHGTFAGVDVSIRNLSAEGFQIEHAERLPLRSARLLRFVHSRSFDPLHRSAGIAQKDRESSYVEFSCETVWSRLHPGPGRSEPVYRSGLAIGPGGQFAALLPFVLSEFVRVESDTTEPARHLWRERQTRRISRAQNHADQMMLCRTAARYLLTHPVESYQAYRRARYALSLGNFPGGVNPAIGYEVGVVAIWEFLGRSVSLSVVACALEPSPAAV